MWHSCEIGFERDHPSAAGHFPGHPIIPGAVLLEAVIEAVAGANGGGRDLAIRSVKFLQPVRPGDALRLRWQRRAHGEIAFEGTLADPERVALVGTVRLEPAAQ